MVGWVLLNLQVVLTASSAIQKPVNRKTPRYAQLEYFRATKMLDKLKSCLW